jgi:ferredoxin-thioredoxin reductase catalytic subunit
VAAEVAVAGRPLPRAPRPATQDSRGGSRTAQCPCRSEGPNTRRAVVCPTRIRPTILEASGPDTKPPAFACGLVFGPSELGAAAVRLRPHGDRGNAGGDRQVAAEVAVAGRPLPPGAAPATQDSRGGSRTAQCPCRSEGPNTRRAVVCPTRIRPTILEASGPDTKPPAFACGLVFGPSELRRRLPAPYSQLLGRLQDRFTTGQQILPALGVLREARHQVVEREQLAHSLRLWPRRPPERGPR